jgi:tyrosine-protein kinase Etk/Wzc
MKINLGESSNLLDESYSDKPIQLVDIINFFWRWRKALIAICILVGIAAIIISSPMVTKPKYKAVHVFYPTTNNSISNALLTEMNQRQKDPLEFGEDEEAEKALQVLQSSELMNRLVRNFNLMKHYGIDPKKQGHPQTALDYKIKENISFERTRYLSINIQVLDEDPEMAANLANGIAALYDTVKTEIQKQLAIPALQIVERALRDKQQKIQALKDQLRGLGEKGVTNYEEQSRALAEEIYKAQGTGRMDRMKELLDQQKTLVASGGDFIALNELIKLEEEKESDLISQFEKRQVDVKEALSHKFTVSAASKPEIKAWPKRSLVVLVSLLAAFAGGSLLLLIYEIIFLKRKQSA